jgi:L-alanine-DL-glutamate epimerase-like enolase superfamily enzyme
MADESVWTRRELREIIRSRAAGMINIKLAKSGGLREALDLVNMSRENDVGIIAGCMAESHVGIAAAAALASAIDSSARADVRPHDLDGGLLLTHSPVEGGVTLVWHLRSFRRRSLDQGSSIIISLLGSLVPGGFSYMCKTKSTVQSRRNGYLV